MKLMTLTLENFKGVRKYSFNPNGSNCRVYGANGSGKTTLADAYFWLLFGKDSNQNAGFSVKTNNTAGLNYSVEGTFLLDDGQSIILKRTFREKWERKRGEAEHRLTGNTTVYEINGVPRKQKEYKEFIDSLCNEEVFSLLTNPDMFAGKLHWSKRREFLIKAFAMDIQDETVISSHTELSELGEYLGNLTVSDFNAATKVSRDKINKRLKELPVEINAYNNTVNEMQSSGKVFNAKHLEELKQKKAAAEKQLNVTESSSLIWELSTEISGIKQHIAQEKIRYTTESSKPNENILAQISELSREKVNLGISISDNELLQKFNEGKRKGYIQRGKELNKKWTEVKNLAFDGQTVCPFCHQPLPTSQTEQAKAVFNKEKSDKLESIKKECQEIKQKLAEVAESIDETENKIAAAKSHSDELQSKIDKLKNKMITVVPFEETEEYEKFYAVLTKKEQKFQSAYQDNSHQSDDIQNGIRRIDKEIEEEMQLQANEKVLAFNRQKIKECSDEQIRLSKMLVECDRKLELVRLFTRMKACDIENTINGKFKIVKWKLFNEQVNGGIEDCCEATVDGISYNDGLNSASRVNAGLDIINVLSEIYGKSVPVWIDSAESVSSYIKGDGQRIYLYVDEKYNNLTVEKEQ